MTEAMFDCESLSERRRSNRKRTFLSVERLESRTLLAAGGLDPAFHLDGMLTTDFEAGSIGNAAYDLVRQPDGKYIVAGTADNQAALVRYHTDGTLDTSFGINGRVTTNFGGTEDYYTSVVLQADGKIVAGGASRSGGGELFAIARYLPDGSLDGTFGVNGKMTTDAGGGAFDSIQDLAIQTDGRIVVAGYSSSGYPSSDFALARYETNGSLDVTFDGDGRVTTDFGTTHDGANCLAIQSDGRIIAGGLTSTGSPQFGLARYNLDGSLDGSWNGSGKVATLFPGANSQMITDLAIQANGEVIAVGFLDWSYFGPQDVPVARYSSTGSLQSSTTIDLGTIEEAARGVAIHSDGTIALTGFRNASGNVDFAVIRLNADLSPDATFDGDGHVLTEFGSTGDYGEAVLVEPDGRIVAAGRTFNGTNNDFALLRFQVDGSYDSSFDADGKLITDFGQSAHDDAFDFAFQADGKIVVAGYTYKGADIDFAIARYHPDGTLDTTFNGTGLVTTDFGSSNDEAYAVVIDTMGRITVAGRTLTTFALARYNPDGSLDTSFDGDGKVVTDVGSGADNIYDLAFDNNGMLVAAGYSNQSGNLNFTVARYGENGSLDMGFDGDGVVNIDFGQEELAASLAFDTSNRIVLAGYSEPLGQGNLRNFALARCNPDGSLDSSFDGDGRVTTDFGGYDAGIAVTIDGSDKIVVVGYSQLLGEEFDTALARYNPDGSLDSTFDGDGQVVSDHGGTGRDEALGVVIDAGGRIVISGDANNGNDQDFLLARYQANGQLDSDFGASGAVLTDFGFGDDVGYHVGLDADRKIVVVGWAAGATGNQDIAVARFLNNLPPVANAGGPYAILEGEGLALDGSGSADPDNDPLTYVWDINGDGTFGDATGESPTLTWAQLLALGIDDGPQPPWNVQVQVADGQNPPVISAATTLTVINAVPTALFSNGGPVNEGAQFTVSFSNQFDPSPADITAGFLYSYDWNNDGDFTDPGELQDVATASTTHVFDDNGTFTVRGRIKDKDGGFTELSTVVSVTNVVAIGTFSNAGPTLEGLLTTFTFASPFDPSATDTAAGFSYSYDFNNDGDFVDAGDVLATNSAIGTFAFPDNGVYIVHGRISDKDGGASDYTATITVNNLDAIVIGFDKGREPRVRVLDAETKVERFNFLAFDAAFRGGVRVAVGDVNGDGVGDIICAPGKGKSPGLRVFDGTNAQLIRDRITPFGAKYKKGYWVAAADFNGDGKADLVIGNDGGAPHVKVIDGDGGPEIADFLVLSPWNNIRKGGVRVATGDVTGDGQADILTAAGKGKSARAVSINGDTFQPEPGDFNPFADDPTGGGRGWYIDDIDVTLEPSFMVNGGKGEILLIPFDDPFNVTVVAPPQLAAYARPLRHGTTDVNGDGVLEIVLGTPKVKGRKPQACVLDPDNPAAIDVFFADPVLTFKGGVFVAGGR